MKLFQSRKRQEDEAYVLLKDSIQKTLSDLRVAETNMQQVTDPDLIDYYIYKTKAVQIHYRYLLNCVKKLEDSYTKNPL